MKDSTYHFKGRSIETFDYKGHRCGVRYVNGFAYLFVDSKFAFRVKHPNTVSVEQYAQEFIDNRDRK